MSDERVREIAGGLNETQARMIRTSQGTHEDAVSAALFPLWTTIIKEQEGHFHIVLNRDGLAVRRILEEGNNG